MSQFNIGVTGQPYRSVQAGSGEKGQRIKKSDDVMEAWQKAAEEKFSKLMNVVRELIQQQGGLAEGKLTVHVDVRLELEKDLGDQGYWGAEKTSERILAFAKNLAGDDSSKIELLKNATIMGFEAAEKMLGGLPDVSRRTYELVMQGFKSWAEDMDVTI
ncbi:MAG: hypothetical protein KGZ63_13650 [Clostridiales bacterium]|jgi:hypothetical protein|nr:hypothetical protein [Clostridiales bacterium]